MKSPKHDFLESKSPKHDFSGRISPKLDFSTEKKSPRLDFSSRIPPLEPSEPSPLVENFPPIISSQPEEPEPLEKPRSPLKKRDATKADEDAAETPKSKKKMRRSRNKVEDSGGDSGSDTAAEEKPAAAAEKSTLDHIPDDIRYNPNSLENKPKGLVDALSNFFTPGLKRTSRTAMNSLLKPEQTKTSPEHEPKKVRLSVEEKETGDRELDESDRKRHASAGQQQVKSLYDGLSHLYSDCDSRLRSVPMTNYNEKGAPTDPAAKSTSPERMSSPHRMSEDELKEKEQAAICKKEGGKEKGTSKETV